MNKISILYKKSRKQFDELPKYHFNLAFGTNIDDLERVNADRNKFGMLKIQIAQKIQAVEKKYGMKLNFGYK